jgi:acyl-CoA synthetase (AMP-forming)/AMP-acid ligase II
VIRGGENIYCIEVENVLYDHPAVMDAALVGIPHQDPGRRARGRRDPESRAPTPTTAELRAFVADRLAAFKVPVQGGVLARDLAAQRQRQDHEERAEEGVCRGIGDTDMEAAMVQSKALSVDAFMTELSDDRRPALERLRRLCREELAG